MRVLLERGAIPGKEDKSGDTPEAWAKSVLVFAVCLVVCFLVDILFVSCC